MDVFSLVNYAKPPGCEDRGGRVCGQELGKPGQTGSGHGMREPRGQRWPEAGVWPGEVRAGRGLDWTGAGRSLDWTEPEDRA